MRTSQEIFNLAISQKYYPWKADLSLNSTDFMCLAINILYEKHLIIMEELLNAIKDIRRYIGFHNTLKSFLVAKSLPFQISDCIFLYQNWDNKP